MNAQHYAEIKKGPTSWNAFVRVQKAKDRAWTADLQGANLWNADIWTADLQGANLQRVNLQWANLQRVNLQWADLQWADLHGADLHGADLRGTKFSGVPIRPGDLLEQIAVAIRKPGALSMRNWHTCETTHCLGGWAAHLTPGGIEFADKTSDHLAGALLVPELAHLFYGGSDDALEATEKYLPEGYTAPEEDQ